MVAKKRVLVVDDEPGIGNFLKIKLRLSGFDTTIVSSGAEAIELIRTRQPDVLLCDVLMPGVTGMDVVQEVRAFSNVPIIIFTGRPDIFEVAKKLGANDYIAKPFNPDVLVEKVNSVLMTSQTEKEHVES